MFAYRDSGRGQLRPPMKPTERYKVRVGGLLVLLGLLSSATPAWASPVDLFGFGMRGISMGGAIASSSTGHEAIYYNPAGLAWAEHPTFSLGYQYASFGLNIRDEPLDVQAAPALSIGFSMPLPLGGTMRNKLALGLGFVQFLHFFWIATMRVPVVLMEAMASTARALVAENCVRFWYILSAA